MTNISGSTIIREPAESAVPRNAREGAIRVSSYLGDLVIAKGSEESTSLLAAELSDARDVIKAVAAVAGLKVEVSDPMSTYRDCEGDEWRPETDTETGELFLHCDRTGQVLSLDDVEDSYGPLNETAGEPR